MLKIALFSHDKRGSRFWLLLGVLLATTAQADITDWGYTVQPGDTLIGVSKNYLANPKDWQKIKAANKIKNDRQIPPGSQMRIPIGLLKREPLQAEVIRVQGNAEAIPAQGGAPFALEAGRTLNMGDQIHTGEGSNLTLRFTDGSRLMLLEKSHLTLEAMTAYGKSGIINTRSRLNSGQVETQATPLKGPAARYEVITPTIAVGVRGTNFRISVDEDAKVSRSEVLEGEVTAEAVGTQLSVPAGFGTMAEAGKAPIPPKVLLQGPDLSGVSTLLQRVPLRFKWAAMEGATSYRAQVFADPALQNLLLDGTFQGNEAKWADLPDGNYMLRVRAIDAQGLEGMNTDKAFKLKARPEPPFVSAPTNKGKLYGDKAGFEWTRSTQAESYHLQIASDVAFAKLATDIADVKDVQYTATLAPGEYYWRISSRIPGDEGPFSDTQLFTLKPIPAAPVASAPKISDTQMEFQWSAGEEGQKYQFQMARDKDFKDIHTDQTLTKPHITLPKPGAGDYFMRIKAIDPDGFAGPFSATQQIQVPRNIPWWLIIPVLLFPLVP
ncbi:MAG: FecR domain-containing protein [Gammaproteobacteria bacterium]